MRTHAFVLLVLAVVLAASACGGGGGDGAAPEDADLAVEAVSGFDFDPSEATVDAGEVTIALVNEDSQRHTFVIDDPNVDVDAAAGGTGTTTVTLEPGSYTFYCDVPGHRAAGMEGTLEVQG